MAVISKVKISLLNNSMDYYEFPDALDGLIRIESVECFDENHSLLSDLENLIKNDGFFNYDYHSIDDLMKDVSMRLNIESSIIEID